MLIQIVVGGQCLSASHPKHPDSVENSTEPEIHLLLAATLLLSLGTDEQHNTIDHIGAHWMHFHFK